MTGLRQKLVALAALTLGSLFAPIRTLALIPHSAPLASSQSALHPSSPGTVLTQSEAAVSGMCRNGASAFAPRTELSNSSSSLFPIASVSLTA